MSSQHHAARITCCAEVGVEAGTVKLQYLLCPFVVGNKQEVRRGKICDM